jgi:MATE family multidrug resistance protein
MTTPPVSETAATPAATPPVAPGPVPPPVPPAVPPRGLWWAEARATLHLAVPLVVTQIGQVAFRTIDTVMLGWLGAEQLAGGALGINFYFPLYLFGLGVAVAISPMVAQALGASEYAGVRRSVRQGFWAVTLIGLVCGLLIWNAAPLLRALGQAEANIVLAEAYLRAAVWGFIPSLWVIVLRAFVVSHSRPQPALVVIVAGALLHGLGDYTLMFGHFGFPALGVAGAGISNSVVQCVMLLALLGYARWDRRFRGYALLRRLWRPDWPRLAEVFRIGVPIGLMILAESGLFAAAVYLMGILGTVGLAAHAIALQCAAVAFMIPLGIAQASTVRVGLAAGSGDRTGVGRAGWVGIALGAAVSIVPAAVFWLLPRPLIGAFLDLSLPRNLPVVELAVTFLGVAAVFQLFDGLQIIAGGALRGIKDTRTPMVIAVFGYWGVGFGLCLGLAFPAGLGGLGVWLGLAVGLMVVAVLLVRRFHRRERFWPSPTSATAVP